MSKQRPTNQPLKTQCEEHQQVADEVAQVAYNDLFSWRRGVLYLRSNKLLAVFHNDPSHYRKPELKFLGKELGKRRLSILASGHAGDLCDQTNQQYTTTFLLNCDKDQLGNVSNAIKEAVRWAGGGEMPEAQCGDLIELAQSYRLAYPKDSGVCHAIRAHDKAIRRLERKVYQGKCKLQLSPHQD